MGLRLLSCDVESRIAERESGASADPPVERGEDMISKRVQKALQGVKEAVVDTTSS